MLEIDKENNPPFKKGDSIYLDKHYKYNTENEDYSRDIPLNIELKVRNITFSSGIYGNNEKEWVIYLEDYKYGHPACKFKLWEEEIFKTSSTMNEFKRGDYIVTLKGNFNLTKCAKENYCFKIMNNSNHMSVEKTLNNSSDSNSSLTFNKSYKLKDWRYATQEEIAEYDRLGEPYDVTTLNQSTMNNCEYKVGDWVVNNVGISSFWKKGKIFKISKIQNGYVYMKSGENTCLKNIIPATLKEIESIVHTLTDEEILEICKTFYPVGTEYNELSKAEKAFTKARRTMASTYEQYISNRESALDALEEATNDVLDAEQAIKNVQSKITTFEEILSDLS